MEVLKILEVKIKSFNQGNSSDAKRRRSHSSSSPYSHTMYFCSLSQVIPGAHCSTSNEQ